MMTRLSHLRTADEIHREDMRDPEYAAEYERTHLANEVSLAVLKFRVDKGWSQTEMGRHLGMKQPAIARLESGEHKPSVDTLERLAAAGILSVQITPEAGAHAYAWSSA